MNALVILSKFRASILKRVRGVLDSKGFSEQQWQIITSLTKGSLKPSEISRATGILHPSVSRILPALIRHEVIKESKGNDDRSKKITLTAYGRRIAANLKPKVNKALEIKQRSFHDQS